MFGSLFGKKPGPQPAPTQAHASQARQNMVAAGYVAQQKNAGAGSTPVVALITLNHNVRLDLEERLRPLLEKAGGRLNGNATVDMATDSLFCLFDVTPRSDAMMHDKYDKVLRVKKSLGKTHDIIAVIGRRQDFKKYPRGTYPGLLFFCVKEEDFAHREPDLTVEGLPTVEGPLLFNYADLPQAITSRFAARMKKLLS
jgi:hypothetical protein